MSPITPKKVKPVNGQSYRLATGEVVIARAVGMKYASCSRAGSSATQLYPFSALYAIEAATAPVAAKQPVNGLRDMNALDKEFLP